MRPESDFCRFLRQRRQACDWFLVFVLGVWFGAILFYGVS